MHRSLLVTVARLESGICKKSRVCARLGTLSLLCSQRIKNWIALGGKRTYVMMRAGVKIMHQVCANKGYHCNCQLNETAAQLIKNRESHDSNPNPKP